MELSRSELENAFVLYEKYANLMPIIERQRRKIAFLASEDLVSMFEYQGYLQKEIETRQDLLAQKAEVAKARHAKAENEMELDRAKSEWYSNISAKIVEDRKQLQAVEEELVKATEKHRLSKITSPIDGVVQQLEVHTIGAIISLTEIL